MKRWELCSQGSWAAAQAQRLELRDPGVRPAWRACTPARGRALPLPCPSLPPPSAACMCAETKKPDSEARKWLSSIGLPQYAEAFEASGYDDWLQLSQLDDLDLDAVEQAGKMQMLPGHRKKLLIASRMLAEVGRGFSCGDEASTQGRTPFRGLPPHRPVTS